jgi:hypothetical protein
MVVEFEGSVPYSVAELMNPRGSNVLSSRQAFEQRKMYKDVPYFIDLPTPLKSLYDKLYFGRVDLIQNGVVIKQQTSNLKQINTTAGNIFVLNFVADAFEDLKQHLLMAADAGFISTDSVYTQLDPINGLLDYSPPYISLQKTWQQRFTTRINSNRQISNRITGLQAYVKELFSYIDSRVNYAPLTFTGYVVSNYSSPMISGLSIELQTDNYSTDAVKMSKYMKDPNFRYFVKAARKFGFYVDRNGPWKLTADPLSCPMQGYMSHYVNVSPTFPGVSFFNHYYEKTYLQDFDRLKETLRVMYNKFATDFPRITIETTRHTRCHRGTQQEVSYRLPTNAAAVDALGDRYWLDVYFKMRLKESQLEMTDYQYKYNMAVEILAAYDLNRAVRYINNEIKPYLYDLRVGEKPLTKENRPVRIGTVRDIQPPPQRKRTMMASRFRPSCPDLPPCPETVDTGPADDNDTEPTISAGASVPETLDYGPGMYNIPDHQHIVEQ